MRLKDIRTWNGQSFIDDFKTSSEIMAFCKGSNNFFKVRKSEVKGLASKSIIEYYITYDLFKVRRKVMVII